MGIRSCGDVIVRSDRILRVYQSNEHLEKRGRERGRETMIELSVLGHERRMITTIYEIYLNFAIIIETPLLSCRDVEYYFMFTSYHSA